MTETSDLPEEKSRFATLAVQLFVIPLAVVAFCVALGALFMWLTAERKDFKDYVGALRSSSGEKRSNQAQFLLNYVQESKRWQGIFDVTAQMSGDREKFLADNPHAVAEIAGVFEEAKGNDAKTRRYLALVLGLLGDKDAVPALRGALSDGDADTVKNCVWALGRLRDDDSAPAIIELTHHDDASVRLMAIFVLGTLDNAQARGVMAAALNDPDELVKWNAAFGLASKGDAAGRAVLMRLLDKEYVDKFSEVMPENRQRYRIAAVTLLAKIDRHGAVPALEKIAAGDADLQVRNAAMEQLKELKDR